MCAEYDARGWSTRLYHRLPNHSVPYLPNSHPTLPDSDIQLGKCLRGVVVGLLASYLLLAREPACSGHLLPSNPTPQRHAWAVSTLRCPTQGLFKVSPLLPWPYKLPQQHQQQQQPNLRPRPKVMMTVGSQPWTGKPSVPQSLQARLLGPLMVVLCPGGGGGVATPRFWTPTTPPPPQLAVGHRPQGGGGWRGELREG